MDDSQAQADKPDSTGLIWPRALALMIDGLLLAGLLGLMGAFALLLIPLLVLAMAWLGTSAGKWVLGLRLNLPEGPLSLRFQHLCLRGLVKYALLILTALASLMLGASGQSLGLSSLYSYLMAICVWPALVMLPQLRYFRQPAAVDELIQDRVSGISVIPVRHYDPAGWRPILVSMLLMLFAGFLVLISLPASTGNGDRAKISSVKANAHTLQTMVETYYIDHSGYPATLNELYQEANGKYEYWKDYGNPYSDQRGIGATYSDEGPAVVPGTVAYKVLRDKKGRLNDYVIYGYDPNGKRIQDKGQDYVLKAGD